MGYSTAIKKLKMWYLTIYVGCVRRQKSYWRFVAKLGIGYSDTNVLFRVPQNIYSGNKKFQIQSSTNFSDLYNYLNSSGALPLTPRIIITKISGTAERSGYVN